MKANQNGFTLVEIAIVLLIAGLMIGGMLTVVSTQVEQRKVNETQAALDEIKEALMGFALANGRLPRPAASATDGTEIATCATETVCTGFIPWTTLGVAKLDSWGKIIRYSVTPAFANAPFLLTTVATKKIQTRINGGPLVDLATAVPALVFSHGKNNFGTGDSGGAVPNPSTTNIDEQGNNTGGIPVGTIFISRTYAEAVATGGEFDDLVKWISLNTLLNRMVSGQKLP